MATEPIRASLTFLASRSQPALYRPGQGGADSAEGNFIPHEVNVSDARHFHPSLDVQGFQLESHETKVQDFYNEEEIATYHEEVKALLSKVTAAKRIEIFDDTIRSSSPERQREKEIREPSNHVHNDYTKASGVKRMRDYFANDPDEAERLLRRRFCIINVWRSIAGPVYNYPMVLCDATTVSPEDLVSVERRSPQRIGEIQMALFSERQRWYYFSRMQMDEALLIKTFDSAVVDGRSSIHSSFQDPRAPIDARESIETRCLVFF